MTVLKNLLVAVLVSVVSLLALAPMASAQDYGPAAPVPTEAPSTTAPAEVAGTTQEAETTDVSVLGNNQTPDIPEIGATSLPVTGSTAFPMVATGIGLVALGLIFRQADRSDS